MYKNVTLKIAWAVVAILRKDEDFQNKESEGLNNRVRDL